MAREHGQGQRIKMEDYGESIASMYDEYYPTISERDPEISLD